MSATTRQSEKALYEAGRLAKRLRGLVGKAIGDFNMIGAGDRVMVCLSGGKDSYSLLDLLLALRDISPEKFEIVAFNLDQKQPGFPEQVLPDYLRARGVPFHIAEQDTYSVVRRVVPEGKTTCGLCSRLRRGVIYRVASEIGATRIALGHHRDDMIETLFLNMFHGGKMKGMSPKLVSDDGRHIVIRPLAYCHERDLTEYAANRRFPIIPCNLCGSQPNLQRQAVKEMLHEWDRKFPGRVENMFRAMQNIVPSHLADRALFDFARLRTQSMPYAGGDIGFDQEPLAGDESDSERFPLRVV
jgi:tRNA 2-thiocytidine biosynthesis protein TtcA